MALGPYWVGDKPLDVVSITVLRGGVPVDLSIYSSATVTLVGPNDLAIDSSGFLATIGNGQVTVAWPDEVTVLTVPGWYTLQVALVSSSGALDHTQQLSFEVQSREPVADSAWADRRDVLNFTGQEVSQGVLMQAQAIVELATGVAYAESIDPTLGPLPVRDLRKLKQAVAYQAAFLAQHEAVFSRAAVAGISQDGVTVNVGTAGGQTDQTALILAPLTKMALKALSWRRCGTSTLRASCGPTRGGSLRALEDAWLRDGAGLTIWQPLNQPGRFPGGTTEWGA